MNEARLNQTIGYQFGLVHLNEDWIAPILKAVGDTTHDEARFSPGEGVTSIWEIVAHVTGWVEDLLYDLTGSPQPGAVDWPEISGCDPREWKRAQDYLRSLIVLLNDAVTRMDDSDLSERITPEGPTRAQRISSILVHNSYHAGQIIKIRQVYNARKKSEVATA